MSIARFTWELRATIPVLHTRQKAAKRRVFREGSLRLAAGLAVLLDGEGRAVDEQTVSAALLDQLESGEEIEFPGHLVRPEGPVSLHRAAAAAPSSAPAPGASRPPPQQPRTPSPRAQRLRQPFKRPRTAAPEEAPPLVTSPKAESPCRTPAGSAIEPATTAPSVVDLWESVLQEEEQDAEDETPPSAPEDLWEAAVSSLQAELAREGYQESPVPSPPSQPLPTPCRARPTSSPQGSADVPETRATSNSPPQPAEEEPAFPPSRAVESYGFGLPPTSAPAGAPLAKMPPQEPALLPSLTSASPAGAPLAAMPPEAGQKETATPPHLGLPEEALLFGTEAASTSPKDPEAKEFQEPTDHRLLRSPPSRGRPASPEQEPAAPSSSSPALAGPGNQLEELGDDAEEAICQEEQAEEEEEVSEDDLPLLDVVGKVVQGEPGAPLVAQKDARSRAPRSKPSETKLPPATRLPLLFDSHACIAPLPSGASYSEYFEHALLTEMQRRLGQLSLAWQRSAREGELSVAVKGARIGRAKEDPSAAAILLGRSPAILQGDVKACSKNDLWIILMNNSAPLLMRSVWKGVNPSGRILCVPVNDVATSWLEKCSSRLVAVTALASGAFASELLQVEALSSLRSVAAPPAFATLLGAGPAPAPPAPAPAAGAMLPEAAEAPELASLSQEQREVAKLLWSWVSHPGRSSGSPVLVRGVFGSGKTRTLAACIVSLDRLLRARRDPRRILLVCQTNVAVDAVLHHLLSQFGWDDFARLGSFRGVDPELLYRTVSLMASRPAAAKELSEALKRRPPEVREALQAAVDKGLLPPKLVVWKRRRLVAATTSALEAAELGSEALRCPLVLVDEATQLTEPAIFYALQKAQAEEVLLMGDPRQLPPRATTGQLQLSALERLWDQSAVRRLELATQFRCHPAIAEICSRLFYNGCLKSGVTPQERSSGLGPAAAPLAVVLSEGSETRVGQSYRHDSEARLCIAWLRRAAGCGRLLPKDFGVVALYRPHAEACAREARGVFKDVEVATVDAFQGGEREAIALCCGRSTTVGANDPFACCHRRLNVALSRARRHLVIFGTECFLSQHPILSHVLAAAAAQGAVHRAAEVLA